MLRYVEDSMINAYREMVIQEGPERITVSRICEKANVSRRTFYGHYESKTDLLEQIFYQDALQEIESILPLFLANRKPDISIPMLMEALLQGIYNNKDFYQKLVPYGGGIVLAQIIKKGSIDLYMRLAEISDSDTNVKLRYACCFSGGGLSAFIIEWIEDGMKVSPAEASSWLCEWGLPAAFVGFND